MIKLSKRKLAMGTLLFLLLAGPASAKVGKMKLSPFCRYEGNIEDKKICGSGTISLSVPENKDLQDMIMGTFITENDNVKAEDAVINFYSGWKYSGGVALTCINPEKDLYKVRIALVNGVMTSDDGSHEMTVTQDTVVFFRSVNRKEKVSALEDLILQGNKPFPDGGLYSPFVKCNSAYFDYDLYVTEAGFKWTAEEKPRHTDHLVFTNGCICELSGESWSCTTPKNDTVSYAAGKYSASVRQDDKYLRYVEGGDCDYLSDAGVFHGKINLNKDLSAICYEGLTDKDFSFLAGLYERSDSTNIEYLAGIVHKYKKWFPEGTVKYEDNEVYIDLRPGECGFSGTARLNRGFVSVLNMKSISEIDCEPYTGTMRRPNGDMIYYTDSYVSGFHKRFDDAIMEYKNGLGSVTYFDGGTYEGTMKIWTQLDAVAIDSWKHINDICLEFINGNEVHANGTVDVWTNSLTEYLKNKEAGNYSKFEAAMEDMNREKIAELAKRWDEVRPSLEEEWGSRIVNALYEYRFLLGTPRGFIERLKELGLPLFRVMGPMEVDGIYKDYIVVFADRVDGKDKISYILRFGGWYDELLSINN